MWRPENNLGVMLRNAVHVHGGPKVTRWSSLASQGVPELPLPPPLQRRDYESMLCHTSRHVAARTQLSPHAHEANTSLTKLSSLSVDELRPRGRHFHLGDPASSFSLIEIAWWQLCSNGKRCFCLYFLFWWVTVGSM